MNEVWVQWTAVVGAGTGLAALSVNWLKYRREHRVRIKVTAQVVRVVEPGGETSQPFCQIAAVNLSQFPVTIASVGFMVADREWPYLVIRGPDLGGPSMQLPHRVNSHSRYFRTFPMQSVSDVAPKIRRAYVATECGVTAISTKSDITSLRKEAQRLASGDAGAPEVSVGDRT